MRNNNFGIGVLQVDVSQIMTYVLRRHFSARSSCFIEWSILRRVYEFFFYVSVFVI